MSNLSFLYPKFKYILRTMDNDYELIHSPDGWEESTINYERNIELWGVIRNYTLPLKFYKEGAKILRNEYYKKSIQADVKLIIKELNTNTLQYTEIYSGDIDFSKITDTEHYVEVNIMESGIYSKIKAYGNVDFEIEIPKSNEFYVFVDNNPNEIGGTVKIPGVILKENVALIMNPEDFYMTSPFSPYIQRSEVVKQGDTGVTEWTGSPFGGTRITKPDNWFGRTTQPCELRIKGTINLEYNFSDSGGITVYIADAVVYSGFFPPGTGIITHEFNVLKTNINASTNFYIDVDVFKTTNNNPSEPNKVKNNGAEIYIDTKVKSLPQEFTFLRSYYVFKELMKKINGSDIEVQSYLLNTTDSYYGYFKDYVLTTSSAIRKSDTTIIKTSFNKFIKSIQVIMGAGFGLQNGKPTLESFNYFINNAQSEVAEIKNIKSVEVSPANEFLYSKIKIGYDKKTYNNNKEPYQEYNTSHTYNTDITRDNKEFDQIAPYRSDVNGIWDILIPILKGLPQAESQNDNDIFMLVIERQPDETIIIPDDPLNRRLHKYYVKRSNQYTITGIQDKEYFFNFELSPKHCIYRNRGFYESFLYNVSDILYFQSQDYDVDLTTIGAFYGTPIISERGNLNLKQNLIFLPYIFTVLGILNKDILKIINNIPHGVLKFKYNESYFYGYVLSVGKNISNNETQEIRILASPKSDMKKLIR